MNIKIINPDLLGRQLGFNDGLKEGDEVYIIAKQGLDIYSVEKVMIVDFWYSKQDKCLYAIDSDGALHREVYATEQEAEAKLKELKGE